MDAVYGFIGIIITVFLIMGIMAFPTMWLWNWLMPEIFGLTTIGFWQALGLNILSAILFKNNVSSNK